MMGEFAGYRCDGPSCGNTVNIKDGEARHWLLVSVKIEEGYKESFTFCSYQCFNEKIVEQMASQGSFVE
jgi:hypothetical protein